MPNGAQDILLVVCLEITPGMLEKPYAMLSIKPGLTMCKKSVLSAELSLQPLKIIIKLSYVFTFRVLAIILALNNSKFLEIKYKAM